VDQWIQGNNAFVTQGAGESKEALNRRIRARLDPVRKDYEDFMRRYPDFAPPGTCLWQPFSRYGGRGGGGGAIRRKAAPVGPEKSRRRGTTSGNYCGEHGPITTPS